MTFGVKKFGDDNAGTLVSSLAFPTFVCVFPLPLVLITVLNLVLAGDQGARKSPAIPGSVLPRAERSAVVHPVVHLLAHIRTYPMDHLDGSA